MIEWMAHNAVVATILAALVWLICHWKRLGPTARHALWLLVLIKLLTPPLVTWPWALPNPVNQVQAADGRAIGTVELLRSLLRDDQPHTPPQIASGPTPGTTVTQVPPPQAPLGAAPVAVVPNETATTVTASNREPWHWTRQRQIAAVAALWLAGAVAYALMQALRIARMARQAAHAKQIPELDTAVAEESRKMALPPLPARQAPGLAGPLVWSLLSPVLLWPAGLPCDTAAARAMLVHELAHVKRRDHWVGWLKLAAGCLWWWHPVYWWTCRRLREEAELACDGWAVQKVTRARRAYAQALLEICAQAAPPAPALAVGIAEGGNRIMERRLRMIMGQDVPLRLPPLGVAALVLLAALLVPAWAQTAPATGQARFTIAKETTIITEPLNADGTPNYVGALNARLSEDVTPENNGFAWWLEIVGTRDEDGTLAPKVRNRVLKMCGAQPTPAGAEVWKPFDSYNKVQKQVENQRADRLYDDMVHASLELWKPEDHPEFAEYLAKNEDWLKKIAQAAERPKWWSPRVSGDGSRRDLMISSQLPSLGTMGEMAKVLAGRATLHAAAGNFDGFTQDVITVKRLSRHLAHQQTLIEKLSAMNMNKMADSAVGTVVGSGKLTAAQCAKLAEAIAALPARDAMENSINMGERWVLLDAVLWAMSGPDTNNLLNLIGSSVETPSDEETTLRRQFLTVELPQLDMDVILRQTNKLFDEQVAMGHAQSAAEARKRAADVDTQLQNWVRERNGSADLHKRPDETRDAYSARVARAFLSCMMPSLGKAIEMDQVDIMRDAALRVLLTAAGEKARTGKWPATLEELPTGKLKDLPADWFSEDGKTPLKYVATDQGARVYSLGRTGRDDGGIPKIGGETNIVVGATRPTTIPSPAGLP
jgi:beta-lactamase regulating signal transducer with metallopeptidase domain